MKLRVLYEADEILRQKAKGVVGGDKESLITYLRGLQRHGKDKEIEELLFKRPVSQWPTSEASYRKSEIINEISMLFHDFDPELREFLPKSVERTYKKWLTWRTHPEELRKTPSLKDYFDHKRGKAKKGKTLRSHRP